MAASSPAWHDRWTARGFARTLGSDTGRCGIRLDLPSPATSLSDWEMNDLLARLSACEVMTTPVIAVGPSRDAREAAWITVAHRIGALPVLARIIHERTSERRAGPVPAGRPRAAGSVTHSPERSSSSCGRDSGGPLHRLRGCGPRCHPPGLAWWFMNLSGLEAGRLAGIVTETGLRRAFAAGG